MPMMDYVGQEDHEESALLDILKASITTLHIKDACAR